jgi:hypothetical protein
MLKRIEHFSGQHTARPLQISPDVVGRIWPHAEGLLAEAFKRTDLESIDQTRDDVLNGRALLWIVWNDRIEAALVTKIVKPHTTKICMLIACGGEGDWPALIETIKQYARDEGCAVARLYGRKGWARVLKDFKPMHVILDCEL